MLIPIIKDFNNTFSYLISNSTEKAKGIVDNISRPLSSNISEVGGEASKMSGQEINSVPHDIFQIGWAAVQTATLFGVRTVQYIISFQWLRDFVYLPISIPANTGRFSQGNNGIQDLPNNIISQVVNGPDLLQRFLFSNQTIAKPEMGGGPGRLAGLSPSIINSQTTGYNDFVMGSPSVSGIGAPLNSWSLSFLSNEWFDPLTVPVHFISTSSEHFAKNLSPLSSMISNTNGSISISNIIIMTVLICVSCGFSSFFNSFFISFPLSLSNLLSLRYLIVQKFWAGCFSVLGIVLGEICFMLFLILPPPFIQITLIYLESVCPYIFGLSLIIFIIFDLISNPYPNTVSFSSLIPSLRSNQPLPRYASFLGRTSSWIKASINPWFLKIFGFSFLLSLTEQSCCFAFFGSLNLSSTANFLDTYLFAASSSPIILFFSCLGFLIGSFLAILIYDLVMAKIIFLSAELINNRTNFAVSASFRSISRPSKQSWSPGSLKTFGFLAVLTPNRLVTSITNRFSSRKPDQWTTTTKSPLSRTLGNFRWSWFFFSLREKIVFIGQIIQQGLYLLISYLPGGKRIVGTGQATSFSFSGKSPKSPTRGHSFATEKKKDQPSDRSTHLTADDYSAEVSTVKQPVLANFNPLSLETRVEDMLRSSPSLAISPSLSSEKREEPDIRGLTPSANVTPVGGVSQRLRDAQPFAQLGDSTLYNRIDKILLTCLITLSFTTIPYYSFDYLVNSFFGFIPQDEILNAHSLRVNFPDYTNLLGITLSDNNSVINTDVSLYDRAHFMYGEWPNSFESLNYQGELMWTNLRDHRRQKRTRRSTRLKFKTLKTKISTSWKEFKRNSGFSSPTISSQSGESEFNKWGPTPEDDGDSRKEPAHWSSTSKNSRDNQSHENGENKNSLPKSLRPSEKSAQLVGDGEEQNLKGETQSRKRGTDFSNLFHKIIWGSASPLVFPQKMEKLPQSSNQDRVPSSMQNKVDRSAKDKLASFASASETSSFQTGSGKSDNLAKIPEEVRLSTSLSETIKPLSTSSFMDLSGGEKFIKTYPKNWKKAITEKYYQNSIYQAILSTDLKNFLKREPLSQQVTKNGENELYFLRVKMAHYYDSLRFYFNLRSSLSQGREYREQIGSRAPETNQTRRLQHQGISRGDAADWKKEPIITGLGQAEPGLSGPPLKGPPFQFKSLTSMNYRQQFKGTLKTVKQLFAISLPESVEGPLFKDGSGPSKADYHMYQASSPGTLSDDLMLMTNQTSKDLPPMVKTGPDSLPLVEKSYKYDKYLFNEYAYSKNEFLHEEAKNRKLPARKDMVAKDPARKESYRSLTSASGSTGRDKLLKDNYFSHPKSAIRSASKTIYNMFGSNDPFYVGWDENLRKFILTSRILSRSNALNYLSESRVQKPEHIKKNSVRGALPQNNNGEKNTKKVISSAEQPIFLAANSGQKIDINKPKSIHIYRPYTSWPFFKHELKNGLNRPYLVGYENYLNILNKRIHLFRNININDIDTKSLTFLYSYSFNNNVKKYVSQLPINLYKQAMKPSSLENLFTPNSNARSSFLWPGSVRPAWEYYFW